MNQQWLIDHVLENLDTPPSSPRDGRDYLSLAQAQAIVDETIEHLGAFGEETEYTYIKGHRARLAHALTMIPKAVRGDETLLDVGCYGYMALWAHAHLGYASVTGIEWRPDIDERVIEREYRVGEHRLRLRSHNLDISAPGPWPIQDTFDAVLFFEVLEHVNRDPMGVMERIGERLKTGGTLVMSVPNAVSYKVLKELLVGMPPWTYWFYEPDLSHEPRHCFEYTPIVFKSLLAASGMRENAFRIIYAYSTPERERETLEIARSLGLDPRELGETMIVNATKAREDIALRYPDVLYSPDGYYKNIYPRLQELLKQRVEAFRSLRDGASAGVATDPALTSALIEAKRLADQPQVPPADELRDCVRQLAAASGGADADELDAADERHALSSDATAGGNSSPLTLAPITVRQQKRELEQRVKELLYTCEKHAQQQHEREARVAQLGQEREDAVKAAADTRAWAESLAQENADLRAQVNELLFACDCYLQQISDPAKCVQALRRQRLRRVLDRSKAVARKTPVLRTALRPAYRGAKKFIKRRL